MCQNQSVVNAFQYVLSPTRHILRGWWRERQCEISTISAEKQELAPKYRKLFGEKQCWAVNYFLTASRRSVACSPPSFSTIHANTPWQVFHSPPRICQRGLAGFSFVPLQRSHNERIRAYTITFLPPGMFLYFHLYLLINKISSKKMSKANLWFSTNKPYENFSLRGEKYFSSRREYVILAMRKYYPREGNV